MWVNQFVGNAILLYIREDLFLMVAVVTQCVKYLGQTQMRKRLWNSLWRNALAPKFNNGANGCPCRNNNGLSTEN